VVRHVALETVNSAIQNQQLDVSSLNDVKENLMDYIRRVYGSSDTAETEVDQANIQNKMTQTITYLFVTLYAEHWQSFFDDFLGLASHKTSNGTSNRAGVFLYLRAASAVHDEIADVLVPRSPEEQQRNNLLKDLIRQRDVHKVALSWQEILAQRRAIPNDPVVEMCLKVIGRWASWVDISLVINENLMNMLFELIARPNSGTTEDGVDQVRNAAVETLTEIVGKKMLPPAKIELISFLKLETIINHLISSPALHELRSSANYDTDLAEAVAKLVNNATGDIIRALETDSVDQAGRQEAQRMLQVFLAFALRFFSDEYDEICSTVIPCLTDLLTYLRKEKKKVAQAADYTTILEPILKAIMTKMKYDETSSWGEEDEQTDEAEFQDLRKRLHVLQQAVAAVDESLYIGEISRLGYATFTALSERQGQVDWRDLDLVLYEMYLFGDLAVKQGGLYVRNQPTGPAAETLIGMMTKMIESGRFPYSSPIAAARQGMSI
jgi:exportin-T